MAFVVVSNRAFSALTACTPASTCCYSQNAASDFSFSFPNFAGFYSQCGTCLEHQPPGSFLRWPWPTMLQTLFVLDALPAVAFMLPPWRPTISSIKLQCSSITSSGEKRVALHRFFARRHWELEIEYHLPVQCAPPQAPCRSLQAPDPYSSPLRSLLLMILLSLLPFCLPRFTCLPFLNKKCLDQIDQDEMDIVLKIYKRSTLKIHFSVIILKTFDLGLMLSSCGNSFESGVDSLSIIQYQTAPGTTCSPLIYHFLYQSSIKAIHVEKEPVVHKSTYDMNCFGSKPTG